MPQAAPMSATETPWKPRAANSSAAVARISSRRDMTPRLAVANLGAHLVHVEPLDRRDQLFEGRRRQRTGLAEDEDALAEGHQRRDRGDLGCLRQPPLRLGVDASEHHVVVPLRSLLVDRRELSARATPGGPEVDEYDVVRGHGLLEGLTGQRDGTHADRN